MTQSVLSAPLPASHSQPRRRRFRVHGVLAELGVHAVLVVATCFALYPLLWVLSTAFAQGELSELRAWPAPRQLSLEHFREVLFGAGSARLFLMQLANSLGISAATAGCALALAAPGAYALSRFDFVGKRRGLELLAATQLFPGVAAAIPLYLILDFLHLLDTRSGLVLIYASTAVPFAIFQLRAAFDAVPRDLEEAALVDGASQFQAFWRIILPAITPALATTALFAFMGAWNEFILAATFLSREELFTLPMVLQRYVGEHDSRWGPFAAGAILVSLPVMLVFLWLQRHVVSGVTSGAVKG